MEFQLAKKVPSEVRTTKQPVAEPKGLSDGCTEHCGNRVLFMLMQGPSAALPD